MSYTFFYLLNVYYSYTRDIMTVLTLLYFVLYINNITKNKVVDDAKKHKKYHKKHEHPKVFKNSH